MFSKNDLNLLKLAINFAKESVDDSVGTFEEYVGFNLKNENSLSLKWKLDELSDRLKSIKLDDMKNLNEHNKFQEESSLPIDSENNKLKSSIISILSQMIEDGDLGLYKHSDYDGEYIGISLNNGNEVVTPRYSFSGPIKL